jgi:hypothetical protein
LWAEVRELNPRPDQLYVVWGAGFPFEYCLPFDSLSKLRTFRMLGLGCATNTPLTDRFLKEFGLPDVVTGLCGRDNVFLICAEVFVPMLKTYIAEHRGLRVEAEPVHAPPRGMFRVFRLRPAALPVPSPGGNEPCE